MPNTEEGRRLGPVRMDRGNGDFEIVVLWVTMWECGLGYSR